MNRYVHMLDLSSNAYIQKITNFLTWKWRYTEKRGAYYISMSLLDIEMAGIFICEHSSCYDSKTDSNETAKRYVE